MERIHRHRWNDRAVLLLLSVLIASCAKEDRAYDRWLFPPADDSGHLAIGTVRSQDDVRFIRIDETLCGQVVNLQAISGIPDGTRVFLEFRLVVSSSVPAFCTDAILVEWATPLEQGLSSMVSFEEMFTPERFLSTDPIDIVPDWITSLEDDFLTLHYTISSGDRKHAFYLYRSMAEPASFYLVHDAEGDTGKMQKDGMICFPISLEPLFHDVPEGEAGMFTLHYLHLDHIQKTLSFEYRSPK